MRFTLLALLAAGVAGGSAAAGFGIWQADVLRLEREVESLERSNLALRRNADDWSARLREGRLPLERRIAELEQQLAARPALPDPWALAISTEPDSAADVPAEVSPVEPVEVAVAPAVTPPVSTSPPNDPGDCSVLVDPAFSLDAARPVLERFGGRLSLEIQESLQGPTLAASGDELSPYPLDELPMHLSFDCEGVPYVISVCSFEAGRLEGALASARGWKHPCGSVPVGAP